MKDKEKLLEIKKNLNRKRPVFLRTCGDKRIRLRGKSWRRPKGSQSKMRERRMGKRKLVEMGYRGPSEVRGLTREGKEMIMINSFADLQKIKSKEQIGMLSRTLGMRQRYLIVKKAIESNISFVNVKNTKQFLTDVENKLSARKKEKAERAKAKQTKEKSKAEKKVEAKPAEKPKIETKLSEQSSQGLAATAARTQPAQKSSSAAEYAKQVFEKGKTEAPKPVKTPTAADLATNRTKSGGPSHTSGSEAKGGNKQ